MKKRVLTVLLISVIYALLLCGCGERESKDREDDQRQESTEKPTENSELTRLSVYNDDGEVVGYKDYDSNGNLVKSIKCTADGVISEWEEYVAGRVTKKIAYSKGEVIGWYEYEYDETGKQSEIAEYEADGKLHARTEIQYDESGEWIKKIIFDAEGNILDIKDNLKLILGDEEDIAVAKEKPSVSAADSDGSMKDYTNTVIFFLDRNFDSQELREQKGQAVRDIVIVSRNKYTGQVRLLSVAKDTFMKADDKSVNKIQQVCYEGPEKAVRY